MITLYHIISMILQINVYDSNYCDEGMLDLVAQLRLSENVQATTCAWINVIEDLLLISGCDDGSMHIVSLAYAKETMQWQATCPSLPITSIQAQTHQQPSSYPITLMIGAGNKLVSLWRIDNASEAVKIFETEATSACFSFDGTYIIYADVLRSIRKMDLSGQDSSESFPTNHTANIECLRVLSTHDVAFRSTDGRVSVASVAKNMILRSFSTQKSKSAGFEVHPSKLFICTLSKTTSYVNIYRVDKGKLYRTIKVKAGMTAAHCLFASNYLITVGGGGLLVRTHFDAAEESMPDEFQDTNHIIENSSQ
ncbi:WD40-repeat-containing domain protein [Obelidium mucronatum]|nr:WD40-repeat-containing domain protein [Obelidium mucronatum]